MTTVDKITGGILVIAIVVVGVLAGLADINGDAALGFISGIAVALVTHTSARVAVTNSVSKTDSNPTTPAPDNTGA